MARAVRAPVCLTLGDPAGIAPEITAAAWRALRQTGPAFFLIGDPVLASQGGTTPVAEITAPFEAFAAFGEALPLLREPLDAEVQAGAADPANARAVLRAIERAAAFALDGAASAVVTNPIHKKSLYDAGFHHPGHTEFLGALCGAADPPVMMLEAGGLRVVPTTIHVPLAEVAAHLSHDLIVRTGRVVAAALSRDFGVSRPRIAVAGLNPHAGEGGAMGREDIDIIAPAVATLRASGIDATGPRPADTMFHAAARSGYDAALCMYHDQALIPVKMLDFDRGVNITLGLPIVRTSPDHGTAFDIAGKGLARADSLIAAIHSAAGIAARRAETASA